MAFSFFFFNDTATTEIYTLSLHDALPICVLLGPTLELGNRHFVKYFLRHCCSRSRSPEQRGGETVRVRVKTDHPLDKHCVIIHFVCIFGCTGGRKRIRRLHALRYAGRSPCRCFSPVLIPENGEVLQAHSRASSVIHLLVSSQQVLRVTHFPSVLQLLPECFRTPDTNLIPSRINTNKAVPGACSADRQKVTVQ